MREFVSKKICKDTLLLLRFIANLLIYQLLERKECEMASWADHFNTYTEACEFFGVDTPTQLEAEARSEAAEEAIVEQDEMEARGGPRVRSADEQVGYDDIPF
jgi:hypothetical protein